jgi:hypothetical protein
MQQVLMKQFLSYKAAQTLLDTAAEAHAKGIHPFGVD